MSPITGLRSSRVAKEHTNNLYLVEVCRVEWGKSTCGVRVRSKGLNNFVQDRSETLSLYKRCYYRSMSDETAACLSDCSQNGEVSFIFRHFVKIFQYSANSVRP